MVKRIGSRARPRVAAVARALVLTSAAAVLAAGAAATARADEPAGPVAVSGTLVSGYGEIGSRDQYNEFSTDGGATWASAWIVPPHPAYSTIAQSRWIGATANSLGPPVTNYRICFELPEGFEAAELDVLVHSDNAAEISLNDAVFGAQPHAPDPANFSGPPEAFSTDGPFQAGQNELRFVVTDYGNPTGLDYAATVTYLGEPGQAVEPIACAAEPGSITLEPAFAQRALHDEHAVTATLRDGNGALLDERLVEFVVISGPNTETNARVSTNSEGKASFAYTGERPGTDVIEASFVDATETRRSAQATVTWGHSLSIDDVSVSEGDEAIFTVSITPPLSYSCECSVDVNVETRSTGSAQDPGDYVAVERTLRFYAGDVGDSSKPFTVETNADELVEPDETFEVVLTTEDSEAVIADGVGVGTIRGNGAAPAPRPAPAPAPVVPSISIDDVSAPESGSVTTAGFTVRLSEATSRRVTVNYATADGSGKATSDYVGAQGTIAFEPGESSKSLPITIRDDRSDEPDETFTVRLSNPTNAVIGHGTGTATVKDDADPPPTVSVVDVRVVEGDPGSFFSLTAGPTFAVFTLGLSEPSGYVVTTDYTTADGTARGGTDYTPTSGTATFQPGETTQTVAVPVTPNNSDEVDRSFFLRLGGGSNNGGASDGEAQATIQDDDEPPPPIAGQSGNGTATSGTILIKLPGTDVFVPLTGPVQLPIGTIVDATRGTLSLQMSDGAGGTYTGEFSAGIFKILEQTRGVVRRLAGSSAKKPKRKKTVTVLFTTLQLEGGDFGVCAPRRLAGSAQEKPKPKAVRRLWGNSKGKFRTKGRHSAATVRGTRWLTSDRCDGTLTYVAQGGPVSVLDFRLGRTIELRQGQTYVARPRGRR
jgi:Calx-beta domain